MAGELVQVIQPDVLKAWVDEDHVYEKAVSLQPGQPLHVDFGLP